MVCLYNFVQHFFIARILVAIFNKTERKSGIKIMVFSVIAFLIGLGGCVAFLYVNPLRIM